MSGRAKGFDPLSNLFDAPNAGQAAPATVPVPPPASTPPTEAPADSVDKLALAKALAKAAAAKAAGSASPPAAEPAVDKLALARRLAEEAKARAASSPSVGPSPAPERSSIDRAELAKALAKAAKAKAAAAAAKSTPTAPKAPPPAPRTLADRASRRRPVSALEAARAAAAAEESARKKAPSRSTASPASAASKAALPSTTKSRSRGKGLLSQLGSKVVAEAPRMAANRGLLTALWKAHGLRHIEDGNWAMVGACLSVVEALAQVPPGVLVAVPATAGESQLLAWVDVSRSRVLAVVPNGRAYLAGLPEA